MTVLVTGVAGFIGYHTALRLLERGERVVGLDNLNDYYSVALKKARLARLTGRKGFEFHRVDLADPAALAAVGGAGRVVHLAAQAGVRHSIDHPFAYVESNLAGHLAILETCRRRPSFEHLVYASSSSVYGGNDSLPFRVGDRVDRPVSLYAATKLADEHMSHCYGHLYALPQTGLRFFTAYGPWGRPDMALYLFTEAILEGRPIRVFNRGDMRRDFTYVDDVVTGIVAALDSPPPAEAPHRLYNVGAGRPEPLTRMIELLEDALGRRAERILEPMQPGDVRETWADIGAIGKDLGYAPTTPIEDGIVKFVDWYRAYHGA